MPTPADIIAARTTAGLTQQQCADMVDAHRVTWVGWESGRSAMPSAVWRLWRHLAGIERLPRFAKAKRPRP